jgi:hypothetical protein
MLLIAPTQDADEDAFFSLNSVQNTHTGISLELFFDPANGGEKQKWEVDCAGVREFVICNSFIDNLYVETEHPVLLMFNEPYAQLYFYSVPTNIPEVMGDLFIRHVEVFGNWIPFARFLNRRPGGLPDLLKMHSGMLADGPRTMIEKYASVLTAHGIGHSVRPTQLPRVLDGAKWQEPATNAKALILGGAYVVADSFDPKRVEA